MPALFPPSQIFGNFAQKYQESSCRTLNETKVFVCQELICVIRESVWRSHFLICVVPRLAIGEEVDTRFGYTCEGLPKI